MTTMTTSRQIGRPLCEWQAALRQQQLLAVRLGEATGTRGRRAAKAQLLGELCQLEFLLSRDAADAAAAARDTQQSAQSLVRSVCFPAAPPPLAAYMRTTGLSRMFPEAFRFVREEASDDSDDSDASDDSDSDASGSSCCRGDDVAGAPCDDSGRQLCSLDSYLVRLGQLNKVQRLCLQLRDDLHAEAATKYAAHQLALLFHVLVRVIPRTQAADFKRRIEERFPQVKAASDAGLQTLPPDLAAWADALASDVLACVMAPAALAFLAPTGSFLNCI